MENALELRCFLTYLLEENKKLKIFENNTNNEYINITYSFENNDITIYSNNLEIKRININKIVNVYELNKGNLMIIKYGEDYLELRMV